MLKSAVLNKICSFACGLIAGVVFSVVILEAALRMGGWLTTFLREGRENLLLQDRERCRIVCLGDSSTIAGADESYPSQLERMLNDSAAGMKFTVINKGEPAVTTKHILSRIEGIIEEYEPNIVVAMMGGNDKEDMYAGSDHRRKLPALHKLRVYKLIMFWRADIKRKMSVKAGGGAADVNRYIGLSGYYAAANDYDNAEKVLKKAVDLFPGAARPYIELGRLYAMTGKYEMAEAAYSRALYINYGDDYVFGMLGALY
ncbi:MAG: tetratricopeptide repeat protein, partial [Candidatus Omnitrophota bacterium]